VDIYSPQSNPVVDEWVHAGRRRFGHIDLFTRQDGLKPIVAAIRSGGIFFLPADMDYGRKQSIFVPFYGVQAATAPSLPRFARLGRAKVVPVIARLTPMGYDVQVYPAWANYPTGDEEADTLFMNQWLEGVIPAMPEQYFWMHRRFKTRPRGEKKVY
jgi:KDO2-lipid IV(A) lauroyltransferase